MSMKVGFSGYHFLAMLSLWCASCEGQQGGFVCTGDGYPRASGGLTMQYSGFAGRLSSSIPMYVRSTTAEDMHMRGCDYVGDDWWWIEVGISIPVTTSQPAAFDNEDDQAARATAVLLRQPDGDSAKARRTFFELSGIFGASQAQGTLARFDPMSGTLKMDLTLISTAAQTLETGPFFCSTDISWKSQYVPTLVGKLDGRWELASTETAIEADPFLERFEFSQNGFLFTARQCDEQWSCRDSDFSGAIADPALRASWNSESLVYTLNAQLKGTGAELDGHVSRTGRDGTVHGWKIVGHRL